MTGDRFVHLRHQPPRELKQPRGLILACPEMRSHVNLARMVRAAGCFGLQRMLVCGRPKLDPKIARDAAQQVELITRRSLPAPLREYRSQGFHIVGLEQATGSQCLYDFVFRPRTVLVVGHERQGLTEELLEELDAVVEIPVYGRPFSFNAATAAILGMYEYCRQFPDGAPPADPPRPGPETSPA